ncbi:MULTISPECIES: LysE family transporter [Chelatococcus]|uniref:Threonine transporter RhtB n=2 Tax=Chelatococcus daeguensis TaxID=444444 RepID=A0AAC9JPC5_9HYPH|nr:MULTISPECIES: LysE family transporter [Chelatococcus]APF37258.1 threonine transporter RhtB [Chelatococcus daeguensis]
MMALALSWLEDWRALVPFVLAAVVVMGSPGPSTISLAAVGAAFGFRRSLGYAAGLVAGTTTVLFAIALGMATLLGALPGVVPVLAAAAGLYILYLAFDIATAPPLDRGGRGRGEAAAPSFIGGFLLALANPKAWLAITAVFTSTSVVSSADWKDAAIKTAVLAAMIVIIHLAWLLAGTGLSRLLHDPLGARLTNVTLALLLVASLIAPLL